MQELTKYQNQQVVVNTYLDEELVNRDGFWFQQIIEEKGFMHFLKEGQVIFSVEVKGRELKKESVFKNFYTINENEKRIEIYFP